MDRRLALAHRLQILLGWNPPVHDPYPLRLSILLLDLFEKGRQRGLIAGVAWHHLVAQGKAFRGDDQSNHHLHEIRALVAAVAKLALVLFRKGWITLEIG